MKQTIIHLLEVARQLHPAILPLGVFCAGALEYIFPPFWGDTLMLLGFFLAAQQIGSTGGTFAAALLGSTVGALGAYAIGMRMGSRLRDVDLLSGARGQRWERIERLFDRTGEKVFIVNRFLPGLRAGFLYFAGITRMPLTRVMVYTTLSNLAWVVLLQVIGGMAGGNLDRLLLLFDRYRFWLGWGCGLGAAGWLLWAFVRRVQRSRRRPPDPTR